MSWTTINRNEPAIDPDAPLILSPAICDKIRSLFPRYDTKRAVLLPALHIVQDALGHIPWQAMKEIADLLDIHPSDVIDTISFYTHFWTHPKGRKVITACRSVSCETMGGAEVLEELKKQLGIGEHETTHDGRYSLVTEECLACCDHAPCLLINEKTHKCVKVEEVGRILADENNDKIDRRRSDLFDGPKEPPESVDALETTSDVAEMKDAH